MCVAFLYFYPAEALPTNSFNCYEDCGDSEYCGAEYLDDEAGIERAFGTPCNESAPPSAHYSVYRGGCETTSPEGKSMFSCFSKLNVRRRLSTIPSQKRQHRRAVPVRYKQIRQETTSPAKRTSPPRVSLASPSPRRQSSSSFSWSRSESSTAARSASPRPLPKSNCQRCIKRTTKWSMIRSTFAPTPFQHFKQSRGVHWSQLISLFSFLRRCDAP